MNEPAPLGPLGREEAIFNAAALLGDAAKRAIYLDLACENDDALRARIEKLLASDAGDGFFAQPLAKAVFPSAAAAAPSAGVLEAQALGERIGRYKLLQKIGEGGLGLIYMAEQEEPVRRRVALKVIRLGMETQSVIARFEAERQALAMMDHPNIAKILDGGVTETGRPYFVMDLVQGLPITQFCDEAKLSTRGRLDLFREVCSAVQHAHQKGIIHRDLKPSNILVTLHGDKPVPKVIDFGIAKATQQRLTDKTLFTQFQQFMGTPAYVSPEQATLSGLDIDTRSDIYSLGVLLYELLTGKTPFDSKDLLKAGLDEMRRTICEKEPPTPSTRVSTMHGDELTTTAQRRGIEPPKLISTLRGDLDWIVMKCLEKDRARRYETANGLAMDIQRHLNNEPVMASPPCKLYRLAKLVRRNRGVFAALSIILALLAMGVGISTWEAVRARRAEHAQGRLRQAAQTEATKSQEVSQLFKDMLAGVGPSVAQGRDTTLLKEILDRTAARLSQELTNQPEVQWEVGNVLVETYHDLGLYEPMLQVAQQNLMLAQAASPEQPLAVAGCFRYVGEGFMHRGDLQQAEKLTRTALDFYRKQLNGDHWEIAITLNDLAHILVDEENLTDAEAAARESLRIYRSIHGEDHLATTAVADILAWILCREGKLPEAETLARGGLATTRKIAPQSPRVAAALVTLAFVVSAEGKNDEAEALYREALEIDRKLLGNQHPETLRVVRELEVFMKRTGKSAGAEALFREELALRRKMPGDQHLALGVTLNDLALVLQQQGKLAEAESFLREALTLCREPAEKQSPQETPHLAIILHHLADVLRQEKALSEARSFAEEALAMYRRHPDWSHEEGLHALQVLATVLSDSNDFASAEAVYRQQLSELRARLPKDKQSGDWTVEARMLDALANLLCERSKLVEAELAFREELDVQRQALGQEHSDVAMLLLRLANLLKREAKLADSEAMFREALALRRKLLGNEHPYTGVTLNDLALVLQQESKLAEAESSLREALTIFRKASEHESPKETPNLAAVLHHLAEVLREEKTLGEARSFGEEAVAMYQRHPDWSALEKAHALYILAGVLTDRGDSVRSELLYRQLLSELRRQLPKDDPQLAGAIAQFVTTLLTNGKFVEAEPLARESLAIREKKLPDDWRTFSTRSLVGACLLGQQKYADAEPLLLSGYEGLKQRENTIPAVGKPRLKEAQERLVQLYAVTGKSEQAADWTKKLADFEATQTTEAPAPRPQAKPSP